MDKILAPQRRGRSCSEILMYFELLRPIVKELRQLYAGVNMPVYVPAAERIEERSVSAVLVVTSFDTPACRKVHSCWRVLRIALSQ